MSIIPGSCHTGARPMREVELYRFSGRSAQFHLTPHEFDVILDGTRYESMPIERSALALGAESAKTALELKVSPASDLVRHLLAAAVTGEPTAVTLSIAVGDGPGGPWWIQGARWMGRVLGVEIADDLARIRCESANVSLKRIGLRRLYSRACSHVLYSAACGATPITATATVASITGRNVDFEGGVPSSVNGMLSGGWLETPDGARHMISHEFGTGVELIYPAAIAVGTPVLLTVGCDHSTSTCQTRFNNLDNYGGFPFIPGKNPFSTGVF